MEQANSFSIKKSLLIGGALLVAGVGALFVKNVLNEKNSQDIPKQKLTAIFKQIRKENYGLYRQIATFVLQLSRQFQGNLTLQIVEQFINGPQSPVNFKEEFAKNECLVCQRHKITSDVFQFNLDLNKEDNEIKKMIESSQNDYQLCMTGKIPKFTVTMPSSLTKQKVLELNHKITKKNYLTQVELFKLMNKHTEDQIQNDPSIMKDFQNPEIFTLRILEEQEIGNEVDPPMAIFDEAVIKYSRDPMFRTKIAQVEQAYAQILQRYAHKMQNRTITDQDLENMENEIMYFESI